MRVIALSVIAVAATSVSGVPVRGLSNVLDAANKAGLGGVANKVAEQASKLDLDIVKEVGLKIAKKELHKNGELVSS